MVLLSPFLAFPAWTKSRRLLRRALPVAAAANVTFLLAPNVRPAGGYYVWLASFVLLSIAVGVWTPPHKISEASTV